ncbi:MAG: pyridoxamine 5'-phosphate oxidase family protein, partial [Deltaproteobacteria bacterium]|nr:pyridoxamine 5'-phosphate oxidase family protein [Deltaproteobacteria bacterium]
MPEPRTPKRKLSQEDSLEVLNESQVCFVATVGEDGAPYATPMNYAVADGVIYLHGAKEGTRNANILR